MAKVSDALLFSGGIISGLLAWFGAITVSLSIFFRMGELISFAPIVVDLKLSWQTLATLPWIWLFDLYEYRDTIEKP